MLLVIENVFMLTVSIIMSVCLVGLFIFNIIGMIKFSQPKERWKYIVSHPAFFNVIFFVILGLAMIWLVYLSE